MKSTLFIHPRNKRDSRSTVELARFCLCIVLLGLLNLEPVRNSPVSLLISVACALCAVFSPYTWLFYVSASQVVPDQDRVNLTNAQIGVLAWILTLPWRSVAVARMTPYLRYVGPLIVWCTCVPLLLRGTVSTPLLYAVIMGCLTFTYLTSGAVDIQIALLSLVSGAGFSLVGYWGQKFGLPVTAPVIHTAVFAQRSIDRIGSGRGDANLAALNISFFIVGMLAIAFFRPRPFPGSKHWSTIVNYSAFLAVGLGLPAMAGTLSRGGLYSVLAGFCCIAALSLAVPIARRRLELVLGSSAFVLLLLLLLIPNTWERLGVSVYFNTMRSRDLSSQRLTGGKGGIFSARWEAWSAHADLLVQYPFFGVPKGAFVDFGEYGSGIIGVDNLGRAASHNVFLDFANDAGLPAALLFAIVFFSAPYRLFRNRGIGFAAPFLAIALVILACFFEVSVGNWKTYWAFLALLLFAARSGDLGDLAPRAHRFPPPPVYVRRRPIDHAGDSGPGSGVLSAANPNRDGLQ